ncbi:hotdog domain-containing protein [Polymorphospora sp. NPDC050346]|uniref:acyl-CoA thioesterase n=1 Tax=Polymorphospora sp. NPDC050346 TaxID=3155780 RepID=UPI00340DD160
MTIDIAEGVVTRQRVYLDDLDGFGVLHHAGYAVLFDRAVIDYWLEAGWAPNPRESVQVVRELTITYHAPIVGMCDVDVHFWVERAGRTSVTYRFEVLSTTRAVRYAEGSRVLVNLDPVSLRPVPLTDGMWEIAGPLLGRGVSRPDTGEPVS